jgi:hypothetical protein
MTERPKSREETPKEGSGVAWRAMPRCNNMSLRRTKSKGAGPSSSGISETLMQNCHGLDRAVREAAANHPFHPLRLDSQCQSLAKLTR